MNDFYGQLRLQKGNNNINEADLSILYLLGHNSRLSYACMAQTLNKREDNIKSRFNSLVKRKLIHGSFTYINERKLGYETYILMLRLSNFTFLNDFIMELRKEKTITIIQTCAGKYDLRLYLTVKNENDLKKIIGKVLIRDFINDYEILKITDMMFFGLNFLHNQINIVKPNKSSYENNFNKNIEYKLDETDIEILRLLHHNSRISISEISSKIKLTYPAISNRILSLVASNTIKGFTIFFPYSYFGYSWYKILLKTNTANEDETIKIIKNIGRAPVIAKLFGNYNIQASIFSKSQTEFYETLNMIRNNLTGKVYSLDTSFVFEQIKHHLEF